MPCPHHDIKIVQRSNRQSAVAAAAYQSGERLFSEYDQKQKYYAEKRGIVHTEIMLPPHAPRSYADRNTLWNAAETQEKQWNSQLARRIVLAIPREIPSEQHADLIRDYCREFFVSKGMIADFAIHDKGDGNPHAHILLTMRAMDKTGKWLPKSRKVYDLDENGERIRLPSGNWKSHKEDTVDWNDQKYGEIWRQGWAAVANRYLEANDRPERLDLRSYERQGLDKIPTVHMGPAVSQMEKRGIQTNIGNLNRDITAANRLMQSIRQMVRHLKGWIADLKEKKAALLEALQEAKEPTLPELLGKYLDLRREERTGWTSKGQLKGTVNDFNKVMDAIRYLREKELSTVESLDTYLDTVSEQAVSIRAEMKPKEKRMKEIDTMLSHSLADAATYNEQFRKWKYDDLPIVPQEWQFIVASGKEQQFSILKDLMHRSDVTEIINACDSGREGELIFRFVYEQANCKKPFSRLWISSMEASAIREGFSNLKDGRGYDNLYQSALCRAKADWLIGINATRLFSILYHKTLNVGRVQTPTLAMLVNRDYAISSFKKEKYHVVRLDVGGVAALSERQDDEAAARQMKAACEKSQAVCTSLKKEKKTAAPPKLFDLTALQREANRLYGFTAKQTLDYAQALYEKRLLTYPRTDSKYITSDMEGSTKELITGLCAALPFMQGVKLQADLARICDNSKVTDHHAILPTAEFVKTGFSSLAESEKKLMTLVCAKLLCAVAAPYEYEAVTAVFTCGGYTFTAKGRTTLCEGWREIERLSRAASGEQDEDAEPEAVLPPLAEGQTFDNPAAEISERYTQPPKAFTEDICCERGIRNHP